MSQVLISAVTEAELLFGAARKREAVRLKTAIDEFLLRVVGFQRGETLR